MNAFSTKFEGTNPFSKNARKNKEGKGKSQKEDKDYIREIRKMNLELFKKINLNYQSYKKMNNEKLKQNVFNKCDEKLKEMLKNIKKLDISIEEKYFDERDKIVDDIKAAKEVLEQLK